MLANRALVKLIGQSPVKWIKMITETLMKKKKPRNLGDEDSPTIQAEEEMKTHFENHTERVRQNLLSPRQPTNIATWNIRTMYTAGKTSVIASEMRRYKISILGLCETRWLQTGEVKLASGESILYSGHPDDKAPHTEGVAFMLSKEAQRALISWEPINSRLITARFKTTHKRINLQLIQCYAPTNNTEEETKDIFYNQLQQLLQARKEKDITILMGDMNAKVGNDNSGYQLVMGKHGIGCMNENGERFADTCADYNLVIGGTVFPHKPIHKATWMSPDHTTENQIDHICINRKFRRSLLDVRVKRGADAGSDHHLLAAKLQLKLKRCNNPTNTRTKFNTQLFQDIGTTELYQTTLQNRFQALQEEQHKSVEEHWSNLKNIWKEACLEVVGRKATNHKPWLSTNTLKKIEERRTKKDTLNKSKTRAKKAAAHKEYETANKEVKKSAKCDKRNYIENLAREAEEAAGKNNIKELYMTTKKLAGKFRQTNTQIRDKQGRLLTTKEEQHRRWTEHFKELLNRQPPAQKVEIPPATHTLDINCGPPTRSEVRKAIKELRRGKAAGPDDIPSEALQADLDTSTTMLHQLIKTIWLEEGNIPTDWKDGLIAVIPKKGNLRDCNSYRGIMLLSTPGKVFSRIILERLRKGVDDELRENQAGFRNKRSCTDQIASLRIIIEQSIEWRTPVHVNFIDFAKAFDSVDREMLWKLMAHYGIPTKYTNIIKNMYWDMQCNVLFQGCAQEKFKVLTGVKQGCLLSPFLFLLCIDWIMVQSTHNKKTGIQWSLTEHLEDLDFADDIALLSHSHQQMQDKSELLEKTAAGLGLKINGPKTKVMRINTKNTDPITIGDQTLEDVDKFTYLGSVIAVDGGTEDDVKTRIGKARTAFNILNKIWKSKNISLKTKLQIFNSNVKTVLLYGSETWRTTTNITNKLQTFINHCLRRILGVFWPNTISNINLWECTKQETVDIQLLRRKWSWIGHTLRRNTTAITKQALTWNPQGKRGRGRPKNTWRRSTEQEFKKKGLTWKQLERMAQDRRGWKQFINGLCSERNTKA